MMASDKPPLAAQKGDCAAPTPSRAAKQPSAGTVGWIAMIVPRASSTRSTRRWGRQSQLEWPHVLHDQQPFWRRYVLAEQRGQWVAGTPTGRPSARS